MSLKEWLKKNYRKIILLYIQIVVLLILISHLETLLFINTSFVTYSYTGTKIVGEAIMGKIMMLLLSAVTALVCFLASKVFAKELRKALILIALGITIISAGYLLDIESSLGINMLVEINEVSRLIIGIVGFFMIFAGLYSIYKTSLHIVSEYRPYKH